MSNTVSVVMPAYNAEQTVAAAVHSIQHQTYEDWELIIVDDGSNDRTADIVQSLMKEDTRLRLLSIPHGGIVKALQRGCAEVRGHRIARMDADDTACPGRFAHQCAFMDQDPSIALCGTHVKMTGMDIGSGRKRYANWLNSLKCHDDIVRDLFIECPLAHPTFMIDRAAFEAVGGYMEKGWAEDYDLVMRMYLAHRNENRQKYRFGVVPENLLHWTEHPERLSMNDRRYNESQFRALKRHYLCKTWLANTTSFIQWGAGEVGKRWLREWHERKPALVVDINPRKIGTQIHGISVISPEELPPPGDCFVLVAVGAPGARQELRDWFCLRGYTECTDFLFVT